MNTFTPRMLLSLVLLLVPHILGAAPDFPEKKETQTREAETASEKRVEREDRRRKARQSFSFSTFPFQGDSDGPLSFQSVRMGSSQQEDSPAGPAFQGFNFQKVFTPLPPTPAGRVRGVGNNARTFENFPKLSGPAPVTSKEILSPTLRPLSRSPSFPRNRDPRRRMRTRVKSRENTTPTTSLPLQPRRLNFVSVTPLQTEVPATDPPQFKSRGVTRVSSLVASDVQNSLEETVRSLEEASRRNDQLIQNCINQAEKHRAEIEELENRTALHIEYAQEKQIEIQHLETMIEEFRNQSQNHTQIEAELEKRILNFDQKLASKDSVISKLKDDIVKLEASFSKEETKKHHEISGLNDRLDNASVELANNQIKINQLVEENRGRLAEFNEVTRAKDKEILEFKKKMEKFKREKLNLLKIVQQLADLGNPANNPFNIEEEDYEMLSSGEVRQTCCEDTEDFEDFEIEDNQIDREFVGGEEYGAEEYLVEEEEGSTSLENLVVIAETADDDTQDQNDQDVVQ